MSGDQGSNGHDRGDHDRGDREGQNTDRFNGKRMRPEHLSMAAFLFSLVAGGGGFSWNVASNRDVATKLDELKIEVVEFRGDLKSAAETASRLQAGQDEQRRDLKALQDSNVSLERRITLLEAKNQH
jgi:hypothetical protein